MERNLQLVWSNPKPRPQRRNNMAVLWQLADVLSGAVRSGEFAGAQRLTTLCELTPMALSVIATRMFKSGISEEEILKVV